MTGRSAWRHGALLAAWVVCLLVTASGAAERQTCVALPQVERFLPETTFLYGGVETLGPGFQRITRLLQATLPVFGDRALDDRVLEALATELHLGQDAAPVEAFAARTGLDPQGSAGIAWVLADPSCGLWDGVNECVLIVLPVRDAARAEALLAEHILPEFPAMSARLCHSTVRRIEEAKERLARLRKQGKLPDGPITWDALAAANPGLKPLRCPAGGEYTLGGPGEPPTCSAHRGGHGPRPEGPLTRQTLGTRTIGEATLVGGRAHGVGYAVTRTHILLSNNMNVLEDAVERAAAPGAPVAPMVGAPLPQGSGLLAPPSVGPAGGEARGFVQSRFAFDIVKEEIREELDRGRSRRPAQPLQRLLALLDAFGGVTLDARIAAAEPQGRPRIALAASWQIRENPVTRGWLNRPPTEIASWKLVPASALVAVGTNLSRPTLEFLGDMAMLEEPALAAAVRLSMAGAGGDGALALTRGVFAREMPNWVLILRVQDRGVMDAAVETWTGLLLKHGGEEAQVRRSQLHGLEVRTVSSGESWALHFAHVGPFAVVCSSMEDLKAVAVAHQGEGADALVGSPAYRQLELADGPASVLLYLNLPELAGQMAEAQHQRRVQWCNRNCRANLKRIQAAIAEFKEANGRLPKGFEELMGDREGVRRRYLPTTCYLYRTRPATYEYDAATGTVRCPRHGTLETFQPVSAAGPRPRGEEELFLSAFGLSGLRLRLEGGRLRGEGVLLLAPQRRAERGSM